MDMNNQSNNPIEKGLFQTFDEFWDYVNDIEDIEKIKPIFSLLGEKECFFLIQENHLCNFNIKTFNNLFDVRLGIYKNTDLYVNECLMYLLACATRYNKIGNENLKRKIEDISKKLIELDGLTNENEVKDYIEQDLFTLFLDEINIFNLDVVKDLFVHRYFLLNSIA